MTRKFVGSLLSLVLLLSGILPIQAITPEEAATQEEGAQVTVTGEVSSAKKSKIGALYINFGGDYPNQLVTVFINKDNAAAFGEAASYSGKTYTVSGVIHLKNGKAEMQVKTPDQLVIVPNGESAAASPTP